MVEGGAEIIRQFKSCQLPSANSRSKARPLVDRLIITVAPVFVPDGYSVRGPGEAQREEMFEHLRTEVVGRDAVMVFRAAE
jgi:riboflavin biosynthesis pyrimidine reductase